MTLLPFSGQRHEITLRTRRSLERDFGARLSNELLISYLTTEDKRHAYSDNNRARNATSILTHYFHLRELVSTSPGNLSTKKNKKTESARDDDTDDIASYTVGCLWCSPVQCSHVFEPR